MIFRSILPGTAEAPFLWADEGLSFWGGVDAATGRIIDALHPLHGRSVAGQAVAMPTTRGSCTGSGILLELALNGHAPAALIFSEPEDVVTLGALIAAKLFNRPIPVLRADAGAFAALSTARRIRIDGGEVRIDDRAVPIAMPDGERLALSAMDRAMLAGEHGDAVRTSMDIVCAMAGIQGAADLIDIDRAHMDGCIYASPANLTFARRMADLGARVRVPTTTNAISVDREAWREQGVPAAFGTPAAALADAYLEMGCEGTFTCAPYLREDAPVLGQAIAWAESNAVIYANSVLGARTVKHPDFLDLCIAVTGRAPRSGVYLDAERAPRRILRVALPETIDDVFWPLLGHLAGRLAPDRIPRIEGLERTLPSRDDLKALCAAFGTTSAAPMLHLAGHTPEDQMPAATDADEHIVTAADLARDWDAMDTGGEGIDLVAIGSPHASEGECDALSRALDGRRVAVATIVTCARDTVRALSRSGTLAALAGSGVTVIPDICWCSISEPVFPPATRTLITNSAKYAHYAPGLSGRAVRFAGLAACVDAALTGRAPRRGAAA